MQTEFNEVHGAFSPDGRWVAYPSTESGRAEIYVAPFPGPGGKWKVSQNGGISPRWRGDSSELFFVAFNNDLMVASVNGRGTAFAMGEVKTLFASRMRRAAFAGVVASNYDVSPDGQRFLIAATEGVAVEPPITLLVNRAAALRP